MIGTHALSFQADGAGGNDHILVNDAALFNASPVAISFWFRLDSTPTETNVLLRKKGPSPSYIWEFTILSDSKLRMRVYDGAEKAIEKVVAINAGTNQWYHVVGNIAANTNGVELFVDSISEGTTTITSVPSSTSSLIIGSGNASNRGFNGKIDDICIFNSALMQTVIQTLYTNGLNGIGCDGVTDHDNDGLLDVFEISIGTDPYMQDSDGDGVSDYVEINYGGNPAYNPYDSVSQSGTDLDANTADTDGDGHTDQEELLIGSDPLDSASLPIMPDGDLNEDGFVNIADILIAQRIALGIIPLTDTYRIHGDVAPPSFLDGVINVADLLILYRAVLGQLVLPPINTLPELIINPGMEAGDVNWTGWTAHEMVTSPVHSGNQSLEYTHTNWIAGVQGNIPVNSQNTYTISLWSLADTGMTGYAAQYEFHDATGNVLDSGFVGNHNPGSGWTLHQLEVTPPVDTVTMRLVLRGNTNTTANLWFDDVSVK